MRRFGMITGLMAALVFSGSGRVAFAGDPPPFPEFTFKRMKVPSSGAGPRITVQIGPPAPEAEPKPKAESEASGSSPAPAPAPTVFASFWQAVSPTIEAATPSRLDKAVAALDAVPTPRLASMQRLAERFGTEILTATIGTKVSPALVLAVIGIESSGRTDAVSSAGATGLMQLMPATAKRFGVDDRTDAAQNIKGGVAYLDFLMREFGADPVLVLAGYNAGEGAVRSHAGVPPYSETRAYVPKVLAAWTVARGLCLTPPELITDACAFRLSGSGDG